MERDARKANIVLFGVEDAKSKDVSVRKTENTKEPREVCEEGGVACSG